MTKPTNAVKDRWNAKNYDDIRVRVPKGRKDDIEAYWKSIESIPDRIKKGHKYEEKGFLSVSGVVDKNVMQEKGIRLNIKVPKGSKGYITTNYKESEIIFDKGSKIEILDACIENIRSENTKVILDCIMR